MHVLISERHDGQPQREVLVQRVLVRVVRDVVHQKTRGATVEGAAAVVRHALELLLLAAESTRARGGDASRAALLLALTLGRLLRRAVLVHVLRITRVLLIAVVLVLVRVAVVLVALVLLGVVVGVLVRVAVIGVGLGEGLFALALVAQHENVAVIAAGVLKVQRAMAVEDEHARALGKACHGGGLGRR